MRPLLVAALAVAGVLPLVANATETRLENARIHTVDTRQPQVEAMVFDADGRILAIGSNSELRTRWPQAAVLDAQGATVVPGLIDAHGHVLGHGQSLQRADLVGARSKAEIIERLQQFASGLPKDAWLLGRGWDQNLWPEGERDFPNAADLDAAFPDRPVWLERIDGHAGWANSAALRQVDRPLDGDWQVDGGEILRRQGKATGVLIDAAAALVDVAVPPASKELQRDALQRSLQALVAAGITGVHDAGVSSATLDLLIELAEAKALPLRITAMADGDSDALARLCRDGLFTHPGGRLQMRTVKLYADGALGSRGALLHADYSDAPGQRGLAVTSIDALEKAMRTAHGCGVQVATHAIGDAGNSVVLDLFAKVLGDRASTDHRWRIEHAQIVRQQDIPRFRELGIIASMQPTHATSDMGWAEQRVGPARIVGGYAWRQFRDAGVRLALGSDFPVEQIDPLLGLYAAISRQDAAGQPVGGWYPAERLNGFEALRGFTLDAAYAGFAETDLGSLSVGKRADFVLLSADPVSSEPDALLRTRVMATYVDGRAVYRREVVR